MTNCFNAPKLVIKSHKAAPAGVEKPRKFDFSYYCPSKQGGRLQRRMGAVLSPRVPTILSRFARLAGTPGYSEVSLSAEIHLVTIVSPIFYSCHYCIEYHHITEDLKNFNLTLIFFPA